MTKNLFILTVVLLGLALEIATAEGEDDGRLSLGDNRFVRVHEYQGRILVDIREYYQGKDGKLGPGKRGIALSPTQWAELKKYVGQIDGELSRMQGAPKQQGPAPNAGQDLPF